MQKINLDFYIKDSKMEKMIAFLCMFLFRKNMED